jgi:hypothetical protein
MTKKGAVAARTAAVKRRGFTREIEVRTGKSTAVLLPTRTPNKEDGPSKNV